ncbi:hypothetical protein [Micromonospora chersina]|uniref:hypothetical protein n=1 Tax=Micromonospora chersina TaxID=47854 RepID=UPI0033DD8F4B
MAGMGPPPKDPGTRVRRNATVAMTTLPAQGRPGAAPRWPLIPDVVMTTRRDLAKAKVAELREKLAEAEETDAPTGPIERRLDLALEKLAILEAQLRHQRKLETSLWKDLWGLPQAVEWERLGWMRDVAQYVRHKVLAELGDLDSAKEARQWSDRLGLTPLAMLRLRWRIAVDEVGERRQERQSSGSARGRIKAVG